MYAPAKTDLPQHPYSLIRVTAVQYVGSQGYKASFRRTAKILISLCGRTGWSDSSLAHTQSRIGNALPRLLITHCILDRICHTIYWKSPVSILGTSGYEIYIFLEKKWLHYLQTVKTLIRCRVLRRLIWVCTVCQLPFYGSPDYNGLKIHFGQSGQMLLFSYLLPLFLFLFVFNFKWHRLETEE